MELSEQDKDLLIFSWKERRGKLYNNTRNIIDGVGPKQHFLHRVIASRMGFPEKRRITVVDGDYHNCRRDNIRLCGVTHHEGLLVDDDMKEYLLYHPLTCNNKGYAVTKNNTPFHNIVWEKHCGEIPKGFEVDHKNRNKLDNRLQNLRIATRRQQCLNQPVRGKTSAFYRVSYSNRESKWRSEITPSSEKRVSLGYFEKEEDAGLVSDVGVIYYYSTEDLEFAQLNNNSLKNISQEILSCDTFEEALRIVRSYTTDRIEYT